MKFTFPKGCENAPKKKFLCDFNHAFLTGDFDEVLEAVHHDIVWRIVGQDLICGMDAFRENLSNMEPPSIIEMNLVTVITHGKFASVSGSFTTTAEKSYEFCDVYTFSSASSSIIKQLDSFIIEV